MQNVCTVLVKGKFILIDRFFLGYRIVSSHRLKYFVTSYFKIPVQKLLLYYQKKGFLKIANFGKKVRYVGWWVNKLFPVVDNLTVIEFFQSIIKNLFQHYSGVSSKNALWWIFSLLKKSASLTLKSMVIH